MFVHFFSLHENRDVHIAGLMEAKLEELCAIGYVILFNFRIFKKCITFLVHLYVQIKDLPLE